MGCITGDRYVVKQDMPVHATTNATQKKKNTVNKQKGGDNEN